MTSTALPVGVALRVTVKIRRVGNYDIIGSRSEQLSVFPQIPAEYITSILQAVMPDILLRKSGRFAENFHPRHAESLISAEHQQRYHTGRTAEIHGSAGVREIDKIPEEDGIRAEAKVFRLGEFRTAFP